MKKIIFFILFTIIAGALVYNIGSITSKFAEKLKHEPKVAIAKPNDNYRKMSFKYISESKDFIPYSKQDLRDIFYSILNNGYFIFTFYCPTEYTECIKDVSELSSDTSVLTHINNFVSPFNSFRDLKVIYDETGEVTVEINKLYLASQVATINNKIDIILEEITNDDMALDDKILAVHDYIINHTVYDKAKIEGPSIYQSSIAYGPLLEGYAICAGYADAMALFLNRWNVPNFKVASTTHVWNAVYINGTWKHLDLTWDDPGTEGSDESTLFHKFYLIDTLTLEGYDITDHDFDKLIYQELSS